MKYFKIVFLSLFLSVSSFANSSDINIDNLTAQAKKENKHVIIFFHMTYCPYCERMVDRTFEDKNITLKLKKEYLYVDINVNDDGDIIYQDFKGDKSEFSEHLDVSLYPTVLFLDSENEVAYTSRGYRETEKFNRILNFISTKSYEDLDFSEFK